MVFVIGGEWCQIGEFVSLTCDMPAPDMTRLGLMDRLTLAIRFISQSEWNMLTAIERLDWMRLQADTNEHINSQWCYYASADIEFWHVNFRSLLDQVALIMSELADAKRQVSESFRRLYQASHPNNICSREGARFAEQLGSDWLSLLQTATWFSDIVKVRDQIVHCGGHTMVFSGPSDGILFQVHGRSYQNLVNIAPLMFNRNVVYFERYAAHLMSHLVVFLEAFASIVYLRLGRPRNPDDTARNCSPGWGTLSSWIGSTLAAIESLDH